jgi:hypothetical protein
MRLTALNWSHHQDEAHASTTSEKARTQIQPIDREQERYEQTNCTKHSDYFECLDLRLRKRYPARERFNDRNHGAVLLLGLCRFVAVDDLKVQSAAKKFCLGLNQSKLSVIACLFSVVPANLRCVFSVHLRTSRHDKITISVDLLRGLIEVNRTNARLQMGRPTHVKLQLREVRSL